MEHHHLPYLDQEFKADVDIKPTADVKGFSVTLRNITKVTALTVDHDGILATHFYPTFDNTAVQIASAMGATSILQVRPRIRAASVTYKVISVDEDPETGAVALNAWWNTGGPTADVGALVDASVAVTVVPSIAAPPLVGWGLWFHDLAGAQNNEEVFATYKENWDKSYGTLTFKNPGAGGSVWGRALSNWEVPYLIRGKRVGSKKTATMVAFLDRVFVDGRRTRMRLSKKGLKSKGRAAKKAVAGFKSGEYELLNIELIEGALAFSNPPRCWLGLAATGTLTKTGTTGEFKMEFMTKSRIYNYDEEKKEVRSTSANRYLERISERLIGYRGRTAREATVSVHDWTLLRFAPTGNAGLQGFRGLQGFSGILKGLSRSDEPSIRGGYRWRAIVKTSLADAERLKNKTIVGALLLGGVVPGPALLL